MSVDRCGTLTSPIRNQSDNLPSRLARRLLSVCSSKQQQASVTHPRPVPARRSADTRFRKRRSEVYTRVSVPWGKCSDKFHDAIVSGIGTTAQDALNAERLSLDLFSLPSAGKPSKTIIHLPLQFRASGSSSMMRRRAAAERSRHQPSGRDPITLLPSTKTHLSIPPSMDRLPFLGDRCIRCLDEPTIRRSRKRVAGVDDHRGCGAAIMYTISLLSMRPGAGHVLD